MAAMADEKPKPKEPANGYRRIEHARIVQRFKTLP
jgi:hypothetical protein